MVRFSPLLLTNTRKRVETDGQTGQTVQIVIIGEFSRRERTQGGDILRKATTRSRNTQCEQARADAGSVRPVRATGTKETESETRVALYGCYLFVGRENSRPIFAARRRRSYGLLNILYIRVVQVVRRMCILGWHVTHGDGV